MGAGDLRDWMCALTPVPNDAEPYDGHGNEGTALTYPDRISFAESVAARWYLRLLLFPTLVAAILLGLIASLGSWWLWPLVPLLVVPVLVVVFTPTESRPILDASGAHLGHLR